jgi:signal transduction histidine kinase
MFRRIYESVLKFLTSQTLPETYKTAVREAIKLSRSEYGTLYLAQSDTLQKVYTTVPLGLRTEPRKHGLTYKTFRSGKLLVLSGTQLQKTQLQKHTDIKSLVLIPLAYHHKTLGVLTLQAKETGHFTKERLEILKLFGALVSLAVQKNQSYNEARAALRTRDLFISMAAHELRTPTTTIQGYIQMIKKKLVKKENVPNKWVGILASEALRLNNLLSELLQVDQIKTGQFRYEWKNNSLREIIRRAIATSQINHPYHRIVFEDKLNGAKDILLSDFDKLLQSIVNLINNSAKFSPSNSQIKILLSYQDPYFKIAVRDQGRGIPKRDLPHVFEGFYKGKNSTKGGMGLGLFLAEHIVQRHKGFIAITSRVGKGTTAEINLPSG